MKKLIYILIAIAAISGCKKPVIEKTFAEKVSGEWHCTPSDIQADIYVSFAADGGFELYQQITVGSHRLYRGSWSVADETEQVITGKYNDGENWASDYIVTLSEDLNSMTMKAVAGSVEYVYTRGEIPAEVKEKCAVVVKAAALL